MGVHRPTGDKLPSCIAPVFLPAVCAWVWDEHMADAVAQLPAPHLHPRLTEQLLQKISACCTVSWLSDWCLYLKPLWVCKTATQQVCSAIVYSLCIKDFMKNHLFLLELEMPDEQLHPIRTGILCILWVHVCNRIVFCFFCFFLKRPDSSGLFGI